VSDPLQRITIDEIKNHPFYLKGENIFRNKFEEKQNDEEVQTNKNGKKEKKEKEKEKSKEKEIKDEKKETKTEDNSKKEIKQENKEIKNENDKKELKDENKNTNNINNINNNINTNTSNHVSINSHTTKQSMNLNNNLIVNKMFTKIDKKEIKDRNSSRQKGPITIILKNEDKNNFTLNNKQQQNINNEIKSRNNPNTITNKENKILNNNINVISSNNNELTNKYLQTNNNNKINFLMNQNNIEGRNGIMKIFGLKNKKKLFTKLKLKNHKFIRYDIKNIANTEGKSNKINLKYNINLDSIKNTKNSFENHNLNYEIKNYKKNVLETDINHNTNNLKLIDNKAKSKDKSNSISLKKKLIKYNMMGMKHYNNLVNNINININNISRSAKKDKFEPSFTNNNIINLNVILNNTSHNNNKNMNSLQIVNDNKTKKYIPVTPSQMRFVPSKKSTLPSITISDRIKPKINTHKFKSINANKYYLNTESNYERVERQKKIFLDNVLKKHEHLRKNYQNKYRAANTYNN
jgi:hypothetical protein